MKCLFVGEGERSKSSGRKGWKLKIGNGVMTAEDMREKVTWSYVLYRWLKKKPENECCGGWCDALIIRFPV